MHTSVTIEPGNNSALVPVSMTAITGGVSAAITGDTGSSEELWQEVNRIENLRYLIVETAFSNAERALAIRAKHLCPSLLDEQLAMLTQHAEIFITHLKPREGDMIMREINEGALRWGPKILQHQQVFEF